MKQLRNKNDLEKIEQLSAAIAARKEAEKREKELKAYFMELMETENNLAIGGYILLRDERTRVSLDKKALSELLGDDIHAYEIETHYNVLTLRKG